MAGRCSQLVAYYSARKGAAAEWRSDCSIKGKEIKIRPQIMTKENAKTVQRVQWTLRQSAASTDQHYVGIRNHLNSLNFAKLVLLQKKSAGSRVDSIRLLPLVSRTAR